MILITANSVQPPPRGHAIFAFPIIDSSDRYMLNLFLPLSEVGLYNLGFQIGCHYFLLL